MGPGTRCFQYLWVPTANLWVQNTILMISLQYYCIPGLAEIKTCAQKMQDAQVTKSLDNALIYHNQPEKNWYSGVTVSVFGIT